MILLMVLELTPPPRKNITHIETFWGKELLVHYIILMFSTSLQEISLGKPCFWCVEGSAITSKTSGVVISGLIT